MLITHTDLDGVGCAVILKRRFPDLEVRYAGYNKIDETVKEALQEIPKELYITDICPSKEVCALLNEKVAEGLKVVLIDHHKTQTYLKKYSWATWDLSHAATYLVHLAYGNQSTTAFAQSVEAYDLWLRTSGYYLRGTKLNKLFYFLGEDKFLTVFCANPFADMDKEIYRTIIEALEDTQQTYVDRIMTNQLNKARMHMDFESHRYKILYITDHHSEVGHRALELETQLDYVVLVDPLHTKCSLRSQPEIDVSRKAKLLGGGGHAKAAGFTLSFTEHMESVVQHLLGDYIMSCTP